jgi:hypothetical protein
MFDYRFKYGRLNISIMELKHSALLMDENEPSRVGINIGESLSQKTTRPVLGMKVVKIGLTRTSSNVFVITTMVVISTGKRQDGRRFRLNNFVTETWLSVYEYDLTNNEARFKNAIQLSEGTACLGTYQAFYQNDTVIYTVRFNSEECKQFTYEKDGMKTTHLKPLEINTTDLFT